MKVKIFAIIRKSHSVDSLCLVFGQTLFVRLATQRCLTNTTLDENRDLKIPRFRCTGTGKLPVAVHVKSDGKINLSYPD